MMVMIRHPLDLMDRAERLMTEHREFIDEEEGVWPDSFVERMQTLGRSERHSSLGAGGCGSALASTKMEASCLLRPDSKRLYARNRV